MNQFHDISKKFLNIDGFIAAGFFSDTGELIENVPVEKKGIKNNPKNLDIYPSTSPYAFQCEAISSCILG